MTAHCPVGQRVRVRETKPNGEPHPHAGTTGRVTELLGVYTAIGNPRAMVQIDSGPVLGNFICVSLGSLEHV